MMEILAHRRDHEHSKKESVFYYLPKNKAFVTLFNLSILWKNDRLDKIQFIRPLVSIEKDSHLRVCDKLAPLVIFLDQYFEGKRPDVLPFLDEFHLLNQINSEFRKKVYMQAVRIRYGVQFSYREIASQLESKAYQAIGTALKNNPFPLVIPCHRVVGSKGLGGFMGKNGTSDVWEIQIKKSLIAFEKDALS